MECTVVDKHYASLLPTRKYTYQHTAGIRTNWYYYLCVFSDIVQIQKMSGYTRFTTL